MRAAEKVWWSGLGTSWSAPCGRRARGLCVSGTVFSGGFPAGYPLGPKTLPKPVLCLCSTGSVLGLGLGLGPVHAAPLTVAFDVICVLEG